MLEYVSINKEIVSKGGEAWYPAMRFSPIEYSMEMSNLRISNFFTVPYPGCYLIGQELVDKVLARIYPLRLISFPTVQNGIRQISPPFPLSIFTEGSLLTAGGALVDAVDSDKRRKVLSFLHAWAVETGQAAFSSFGLSSYCFLHRNLLDALNSALPSFKEDFESIPLNTIEV